MRGLALCVFVGLMSVVSAGPGLEVVEQQHPDGHTSLRETRVDGHRVGLQETWWPNGQLRSRAWFRRDVFHGEYRTWRQDGSRYELRHFVDGREEGRQQSWDETGKLYLNYEVRAGRRYGFVNAYPCAPSMAGARPAAGGQS